jgi:hypothetical protein
MGYNMKIRPSQSYKTPNYPTNDIVKQEPAWLRSNIPASWKGKKRIAQMLSVLLFGGTVMPNDFVIGDPKLPKEVIARLDSLKIKAVKEDKQAAVLVAPIFEHGGGRGSTGCVVISPPVFLSEEEARQTIENELKKKHIEFLQHDLELGEVNIQYYDKEFVGKEQNNGSFKFKFDSTLTESHVVLDGYNDELNLGYICITQENYYRLGGNEDLNRSVQGYAAKNLAESIRQVLINYGKINIVVFYDPLVNLDDGIVELFEWNPPRKSITSDARHELRKQVRDFIKWKKTQTENPAK